MEKDKWNHIWDEKDTNFGNVITCDTRDFAVITHDNTVNFNNIIYDETSVFEKDEILPFLKLLKDTVIENGCYNHGTNIIKYNIPDDSSHFKGWVKYISFVEHNGKYVMYISKGNNIFVLSKTYINPKNIKF